VGLGREGKDAVESYLIPPIMPAQRHRMLRILIVPSLLLTL